MTKAKEKLYENNLNIDKADFILNQYFSKMNHK